MFRENKDVDDYKIDEVDLMARRAEIEKQLAVMPSDELLRLMLCDFRAEMNGKPVSTDRGVDQLIVCSVVNGVWDLFKIRSSIVEKAERENAKAHAEEKARKEREREQAKKAVEAESARRRSAKRPALSSSARPRADAAPSPRTQKITSMFAATRPAPPQSDGTDTTHRALSTPPLSPTTTPLESYVIKTPTRLLSPVSSPRHSNRSVLHSLVSPNTGFVIDRRAREGSSGARAPMGKRALTFLTGVMKDGRHGLASKPDGHDDTML